MRDSLSGVQGHLAFCQERTVSDDCGEDSESKLLLSQAGKVSNDYKLQPRALRVARWEGVGGGQLNWKVEKQKITGNFSTRLLLRPCFVWLLCLNANGSFRTYKLK